MPTIMKAVCQGCGVVFKNLTAHRCKRAREVAEVGAQGQDLATNPESRPSIEITVDVPPPAAKPNATDAIPTMLNAAHAVALAPLNVEVVAGARMQAAVESLIGSPDRITLAPRVMAAFQGNCLLAPPRDIAVVLTASGGWSPADRSLLAAFIADKLAAAHPAVMKVLYALFIPVAVALLRADGDAHGTHFDHNTLMRVAQDPAGFARVQELVAATRLVSGAYPAGSGANPVVNPQLRVPFKGRCHNCHNYGHRSRLCPRRRN